MQALRSIYIWVGIAVLTSAMYVVGAPLFLATMWFDPTRRIGHWYAHDLGSHHHQAQQPLVVRGHRAGAHPAGSSAGGGVEPPGHGRHHDGVLHGPALQVDHARRPTSTCRAWAGSCITPGTFRCGAATSRRSCSAWRGRAGTSTTASAYSSSPRARAARTARSRTFKAGAFKLALEAGRRHAAARHRRARRTRCPSTPGSSRNEHTPMRMLVGDVISTKGMTTADQARLVEITAPGGHRAQGRARRARLRSAEAAARLGVAARPRRSGAPSAWRRALGMAARPRRLMIHHISIRALDRFLDRVASRARQNATLGPTPRTLPRWAQTVPATGPLCSILPLAGAAELAQRGSVPGASMLGQNRERPAAQLRPRFLDAVFP